MKAVCRDSIKKLLDGEVRNNEPIAISTDREGCEKRHVVGLSPNYPGG